MRFKNRCPPTLKLRRDAVRMAGQLSPSKGGSASGGNLSVGEGVPESRSKFSTNQASIVFGVIF